MREKKVKQIVEIQMSDEINYVEEIHSIEQDQKDISMFPICWYITTESKCLAIVWKS